jgi:hypothetical protein
MRRGISREFCSNEVKGRSRWSALFVGCEAIESESARRVGPHSSRIDCTVTVIARSATLCGYLELRILIKALKLIGNDFETR